MPTVQETPIDGFAHCPMPRCPGVQQEQVEAVRVVTSYSFVERGGDLPGEEFSFEKIRFANAGQDAKGDPDPEAANDVPCPHCGRSREITDQPRKTYAALSGHDPMGLLGAAPFDPRVQTERVQELQAKGADPEKEALAAQNLELMERLAALEALVVPAGVEEPE